jgi:hypothetical protein
MAHAAILFMTTILFIGPFTAQARRIDRGRK